MKNIILFDDHRWNQLLPLTYIKPISELRVGILTIKEKWEYYLRGNCSFVTQAYLAKKYPINIAEDNLFINGSLLPNIELAELILALDDNSALLFQNELLAARIDAPRIEQLLSSDDIENLDGIQLSKNDTALIKFLSCPEGIFIANEQELIKDFKIITDGRKSLELHPSNVTFGDFQVFIEAGAKVRCSILNSEEGPIYIGKDAEIMEGTSIRGPFAMGNNSVLKLNTKIYGATTLGPFCKVGGEVNNSVLQGYSSKSHDGFLGNSVIGEWCNLGANTNNSNLKNNYAEVKLWDYNIERFRKTGLQFCGLIMGDHSKCGINTMFNTGTIAGVFCNIYGSGYPRNFIPSFSWGGNSGFMTYKLNKVFEVADIVMKRRNKNLSEQDKAILSQLFETTKQYRSWDK